MLNILFEQDKFEKSKPIALELISLTKAFQNRSMQPSGLEAPETMLTMTFTCPSCKNTLPVIKRLAVTGTGLTKIMDLQKNHLLSVSCQLCGLCQIYDTDIIEGKGTRLSNFVDLLIKMV